jgi:very-short-patch-repair endonuclease
VSATDRARVLRKKPTWAEKLLWRWLRGRRFTGYKFRRQHPVGNYTLDFFCEAARLNVELDGFGHGHPQQQVQDADRAEYLAHLSIQTLRFWNGQLRREPEVVRNAIFEALQQRAPHPLPDYTRPLGAERKDSQR